MEQDMNFEKMLKEALINMERNGEIKSEEEETYNDD